jgi:hypothetical protein
VVDADGIWSALSLNQDGTTITEVAVADGDVYYACRGTFYVKFTMSTAITAEWHGAGIGTTTFDGGGVGPILYQASGGSASMDNLRLQRGAGVTVGSNTYGGAIYTLASTAPTAPTLSLSTCEILDSSPGSTGRAFGGAIAARNAAWVVIDDCLLSGNAAGYGGAISAIGSTSSSTDVLLEITGGDLRENDATAGGGAIHLDESADAILTDTLVFQNTANDGAGLYSEDGGFSVSCAGSGGVYANDAGDQGGGAALGPSSTATLSSTACGWGNTVLDNSCAGSSCGVDVAINTSGSSWTAYSAYTSAETFSCTGGAAGTCSPP